MRPEIDRQMSDNTRLLEPQCPSRPEKNMVRTARKQIFGVLLFCFFEGVFGPGNCCFRFFGHFVGFLAQARSRARASPLALVLAQEPLAELPSGEKRRLLNTVQYSKKEELL